MHTQYTDNFTFLYMHMP